MHLVHFRFIVKKGAQGLKCTKIENKIALRMVQNGDIVLDNVFVPDEDRLSGFKSSQDINKVSYIYPKHSRTSYKPVICVNFSILASSFSPWAPIYMPH